MFKIAMAGLMAKTLASFKKSKNGKDLGITEDIIDGVSTYLKNDSSFEKEVLAEVEKARQHDLSLSSQTSKFVINIRGLIRPLCTITAVTWYIYAKLNAIELNSQDYSIIGGILAFWFGFRSYEKKSGIF